MQIFPLSQSKSGRDHIFMKKITVRLQSNSNKIPCRPDPIQVHSNAHLWRIAEMITIRLAGWIFGRIVNLQPVTDIHNLISNGNRCQAKFLLAKFLTSRHVRMNKVIFYMSNTLRKVMFRACGLAFRYVCRVMAGLGLEKEKYLRSKTKSNIFQWL